MIKNILSNYTFYFYNFFVEDEGLISEVNQSAKPILTKQRSKSQPPPSYRHPPPYRPRPQKSGSLDLSEDESLV